MEHYSFQDIRENANCVEILERAGHPVDQHGRCAAFWRGGTNDTSVHVEIDQWFDHGAGVGGGALELYALIHYSSTGHDAIQKAQDALGRQMNLRPVVQPPPSPLQHQTRYDKLLEDGYEEVCRYDYKNAGGFTVYQVIRLEHPEKSKEFLQCRADGRWGLGDTKRVLYNLPKVLRADYAIIVEGEKDAETLIRWGLCATTNSGGAKAWEESFNEVLAGKKIILLPDNDEVGHAHMTLIARSLAKKAVNIRMVCLSDQPKGDVTDWASNGGTRADFFEIAKNAPLWTDTQGQETDLVLAKEANQTPFRNYIPVKSKTPKGIRIDKQPRLLLDIVKDLKTRFLGFPRILGNDTLFDRDMITGKIHPIRTPKALTAWIQAKSTNTVDWHYGPEFVSRDELFEGLICPHEGQQAYETISQVPDWPTRDDVYYLHPPLPKPTPGFDMFRKYIDRFLFSTHEDRNLYASCCLESLRYDPGGTPMFCFVSPHGQGSGKSQAAEMLAELLDQQIVPTTPREIRERFDQLMKRLLSATGRQNRVVLLDNLTGKFYSDELASLITAKRLSGRPAYAKGEESRSNDLVFITTSNGAILNTDLAVRSVFVSFKKPKSPGRWKEETIQFINENRYQILADMIGMLDHYQCPGYLMPVTRFAGWETQSLWAACEGSADAHDACVTTFQERGKDSNDDEEIADMIQDAMFAKLQQEAPYAYSGYEAGKRVFVQSSVVTHWLENALIHAYPKGGQTIIVAIRDLVKSGHLPTIENHDECGWRLCCNAFRKRGFILNQNVVRETPDGLPFWAVINTDKGISEQQI